MYYVIVKTSDLIANFMIYLIFPSASQLACIGYLQARAKLSAFEYESKESNNHTKR